MPRLSEMELPVIDVVAPDFTSDPHRHYAEALQHFWLGRFAGGGVMLLDQQSMKDFLSDTEHCGEPFTNFVTEWKAEGTPWGKMQLDLPVSLAGEKHRRLRALIAPAFTPRQANRHRQFIRQRINEILDQVEGQKSCDFGRLSAQYPISIICALLGFPPGDMEKIESWLGALVDGLSQNVDTLPKLNAAVVGLLEYAAPVIAARRAGERQDDLLQALIDAADNEDRLTDEELHHFVISLLSGGYDTTKNQLNHIVKMMTEFPEEYAKLSADPEGRSKAFIEEALRFRTMFGATARVTKKEFTYRDVTFPADMIITIPLTFGGRDPSVNDDPGVFNLDRRSPSHIAFGAGPHYCPAAFLARALLEEALPVVVRRLPNIRIAGEVAYRSPIGAWEIESLPIVFD